MGKPSASKASWNLPQPKMANTDLSALLKSEAIRAVLRAPNRKVTRKVIRTKLQLNPYAAVSKKNAELTTLKNIHRKTLEAAKKAGNPLPVDPMAKRNAIVKK